MQFIATLLSVGAVASAAAVAPRADYGYWDFKGSVSYPASGYTSYSVEATYHNSEIADPIGVTCSYEYSPPTQTADASCSDPSFSYDLGDVRMANPISNVTLQQVVGLWGEQVTVIGVKEIEWNFSSASGRSGSAEGTIEVTTATA